MMPVLSMQGYIVTDDLLNQPLYNDWNNKTFAQILVAKADLKAAIGGIIPTPKNQEITAYLYSILIIALASE